MENRWQERHRPLKWRDKRIRAGLPVDAGWWCYFALRGWSLPGRWPHAIVYPYFLWRWRSCYDEEIWVGSRQLMRRRWWTRDVRVRRDDRRRCYLRVVRHVLRLSLRLRWNGCCRLPRFAHQTAVPEGRARCLPASRRPAVERAGCSECSPKNAA